MKDCLFCKIANKEQDADIVAEGDDFIAFEDINPKAPVHVLIVPKKHVSSVNNVKEEDKELMGNLFLAAQKVAEKKGVKEQGYRLIVNTGKKAGQEVEHLHLHLISGKNLGF